MKTHVKTDAYSGYAACSGCSLCLLACPVWRTTHDIRLTPHGRAKALQHGASALDLAQSIDSCTLCGACEPACPEEIDLIGMVTSLRSELNRSAPARTAPLIDQMASRAAQAVVQRTAAIQIVPDRAMADYASLLQQVVQLFGGSGKAALVADDGADIALALEAGVAISEARLSNFLAPLRTVKHLIVGDGLLLRALRSWLPRNRIESLGVAASSLPAVRRHFQADDFYVIEPRAYHGDRERLVKHYDGLRIEHGMSMNLDLQRLAIPTTADSMPSRLGISVIDLHEQARWILQGRSYARIIVEDFADLAVFRAVTNQPVVHLAQLSAPAIHPPHSPQR